MTIQELVNSGGIRVGSSEGYTPEQGSPKEVAARLAENYAGCVVLRADDEVPAEILELASNTKHCWCERYYLDRKRWGCQGTRDGQRVYNDPEIWLVAWSTAEIEAIFTANKRAESEVSPEYFHAMRSAGIEDCG